MSSKNESGWYLLDEGSSTRNRKVVGSNPTSSSWRAPNGRRYRVEACEGPPAPTGRGQRPHGLALRQVVPADAQVQVRPAALPRRTWSQRPVD